MSDPPTQEERDKYVEHYLHRAKQLRFLGIRIMEGGNKSHFLSLKCKGVYNE